jgi:hypothetical protein
MKRKVLFVSTDIGFPNPEIVRAACAGTKAAGFSGALPQFRRTTHPASGSKPRHFGFACPAFLIPLFFFVLLLAGATNAGANCIAIKSPLAGATVSGSSVAVGTSDTCAGVWFESLYVDGSHIADFPPGTVILNSTKLTNGSHTLKVTSQSENPGSVTLGSASESVNVRNGSVTCISIKSPLAGATVSGSSVAIGTNDACAGLWFESLYVNGSHIADFAPGKVVFNSTAFANGTYTVKVTSQSENPGSIVLGSASESLAIKNGVVTISTPKPTPTPKPTATPAKATATPSRKATATPSPKATATPSRKATATPSPKATATPSPKATATVAPVAHLSNLAPKATLPLESTCTTLANQSKFPETTSGNVNDGTGWDSNNQIWTTPSYFYANAGRGLAPNSDFSRVDGKYAGTTQDIIRWAACKWGVDEDWAYAESSQEHGWVQDCAQLHGGTTCNGGGDCNNPDSNSGGEAANLSFMGFPVTNSSGAFVGTNGYGDSGCGGQWASWGIIQSKVQSYEWYTWPMIALSTAWGEDYRWAKYRACVNGDYANWFGSNSDYLNAVSRATSNPNGIVPAGQAGPTNLFSNETNLQYLGLGCIGTHYSGAWYDSGAVSYLTSSGWGFIYILNNSAWPGGRR